MTIILSTLHPTPEKAIDQLRLLATAPAYEPLPNARTIRVRWALPTDDEPQGGVDIQVNGDLSLKGLSARACGSFLGDWRLLYIADESCAAINPVSWRNNLTHAHRAKTAIVIILDEHTAPAAPAEPPGELSPPSPYTNAHKQLHALVAAAAPSLRPSHQPYPPAQLAYVYVDDDHPKRAVVVGYDFDRQRYYCARAGNPSSLRVYVSTAEALADELQTMQAED